MSTQTTTRKDVRNAIVSAAQRFASLQPQWSARADLTDLAERTQAAMTAAAESLKGTKPLDTIREALATAGGLLQELEDGLAKPAAAAAPKATRTRGPAKPPEIRELFRDDEAHILVNWILDPAAPRFVVVQASTASSVADEELLVVKATRQWAGEKKQALELAARKACEIKGVEYIEPEKEPAPTRRRGQVNEKRDVVFGDEATVAVVMVTGGENRYEVVVAGEVKHTIKATKNWRLERQEAIGQATQLATTA